VDVGVDKVEVNSALLEGSVVGSDAVLETVEATLECESLDETR